MESAAAVGFGPTCMIEDWLLTWSWFLRRAMDGEIEGLWVLGTKVWSDSAFSLM